MMRKLNGVPQSLSFLVLALVFIEPRSLAKAYELDPGAGHCVGNSDWSLSGFPAYRNEPVYSPCYPLNYSPALTINRPPITLSELQTAAENSYEQWHHDGWSRMRLNYDRNACTPHSTPNDGSWWDNGNEVSEIWWSTDSEYAWSPPSWGATQWDREACFIGGDNEYLAADIDVRDGVAVRGAEVANMWSCLWPSNIVEDINLHEIGHAYGFQHNNAWLTTMNATVGGGITRKCNVGEGWAAKPWSDETQGMMAMYGFTNWTDYVDVSGSHRWGTMGSTNSTFRTRSFCQSAGNTSTPSTDNLGWTYGNHYGNPGGIYYRYLLLPEAYSGTDPLAHDVTSSPWSHIASNWTFPGAAYNMNNQIISFDASVLPVARYRTWVQLWVSSTNEVDPGDNIFPLAYLVRINAC